MKIVITGITSFRNRGVEALVTTSLVQLRRRIPGARFLVLDRLPEYDGSRLSDPDVAFRFDESVRPLKAGRLRRLILRGSSVVSGLGRDYQEVLGGIRSASAVVASGGDVFCSEYGHESLLSHLAPLQVAIQAGVPVFIHAQSIGPFKDARDADAFSAVARRAAHITVRERRSLDYVTQSLGLSRERVTLTADPAFLLQPVEAPWREHYHAPDGRPLVALSTSQAICNWMGSNYEQHFATWCRLIEYLRRELDATLILIPHVQELSSRNDDRVLATALQRHFRFDPHLQLAGGDFGAADFKGIISRCGLVVAERMHAAIAGLSSGIPTVVVGYSVKAEGILGDLFEPDTVKQAVLMSLEQFLDPDTACARVAAAWKERAALAGRLAEQLPGVKERAGLSFDIIARHLGVKDTLSPDRRERP